MGSLKRTLAFVKPLLKLANATTDAAQKLRDLLASEEDENNHQNNEPLLDAEKRCEKVWHVDQVSPLLSKRGLPL